LCDGGDGAFQQEGPVSLQSTKWPVDRLAKEGRFIPALKVVVGLVFAAQVLALANNSRKPEDLFAAARLAQEKNDLENAERLYLQYLRVVPQSAEGHVNLGVVYAHEDKPEKAIVEYRRALTIAPSLQPVYLNLAILYFKQGAYAEAVKPLQKFLAWQPHNRQANHLLGLCYIESGQYNAALRTLAPLRADNDPAILLALATAYIRSDRSREGEELIRQFLTSQPDSSRVHFMLAQTYLSLGQFPQALTEFERVYALDPAWPQIHLFLGAAKAKSGRFDEAEKELRAELQLDPASFLASFTLGALLNKQARYEEAIPILEGARSSRPKDSDANYQLAWAYWKLGTVDKAWDDARAATKTNPGNRPAHYLLAQIARKKGDEQLAQREFRIAQSLSEAESEHDILRLKELGTKSGGVF